MLIGNGHDTLDFGFGAGAQHQRNASVEGGDVPTIEPIDDYWVRYDGLWGQSPLIHAMKVFDFVFHAATFRSTEPVGASVSGPD